MTAIRIMAGATETDWPMLLAANALASAVLTVNGGGVDPAAPAANLLTPTTFDLWRPASASPARVEFDWPAPVTVDCLAIAGHYLHRHGASLAVEGRATAGGAWSSLAPAAVVADAGPVVILFAATALHGIRLSVTYPAGAYPSIAVAMAGKRLVLPAFIGSPYVRSADAGKVDGEAVLSRKGQYLGAVTRREGGRLAPQFSPVARSWADANLPAFRAHYDGRRPFIFAAAPAAFPDDAVYGWRAEGAAELGAQLIGPAHVRLAMELDFHAG